MKTKETIWCIREKGKSFEDCLHYPEYKTRTAAYLAWAWNPNLEIYKVVLDWSNEIYYN